MDHELLTDEIVAEVREEIKGIAEASEEVGSGEERLNRWEQGLRRVLNRLGAKLTEREVEALGREQESGRRVCEQCGEKMRNVSRQSIVIQSIFGGLAVKRRRFTCSGCARTDYPLDRYYGWEQHRFTSTAKEWVCLLAQGHPYESAVDLLGRLSGIRGTVESFRGVVQECGGELQAQQEEWIRLVNETDQPYPPVPPPAPWMLVGADGCQVLKSGEQVGRPQKGEKRARKRRQRTKPAHEQPTRDRGVEVKVGVVAALVRRPGISEYVVEQKSYVATFAPAEAFSDLLFAESLQRGVPQAERVIVMGDGASWIWKRVAPLFPQREEIVDWYHLTEKVRETGEALYGSQHWASRNWIEQQTDKLWNGNVPGVQRALHAQRQKWEPRANNQQALDKIHTLEHYLTEHVARMNYPRYRQLGLPISSSEVESACKQVVAARMKCSGMLWRAHSAAPLLPLRAEFLSGRWDQKWQRLRAAA